MPRAGSRLRPPQWLGSRARLYAILILAVPLAALVLRPGNAGYARYYLASALGLLLLLAEWLGRAIDRRGPARALAWAPGRAHWRGLMGDAQLVALGRGQPDAAVAMMAAQPGARVALAPARLEAALALAAVRRGTPIGIANGCAPAAFCSPATGA